MPLNEQDVSQALAQRQYDAQQVIDRWGSTRVYYRQWQDDQAEIMRVFRNEWTMRWPDGAVEKVDPSIPNMLRLAADDRAREVAATPPTITCRPEGPGDDAREKANKLERIVSAWLAMNRVQGYQTSRWAYDAMASGLVVCKVLPDFSKKGPERFPIFTRLEPQLSYPDPVFASGPFLDTFMYSYEDYRRNVETKYDVKFTWRTEGLQAASAEKVRVIEYYDDTWIYVVVESTNGDHGSQRKAREMIVQEKHGLSKCPVVIGARPTLDGTYSSEFAGGLGVMGYWNRLMTMVMDDATHRVYPERLTYNVENPEDAGPDAEIRLETPDARYEYVGPGNQPFSNLQILNLVSGSVRSSFILPLSRSGDPNESIISAAGVNANQTQFNTAVQTTQRLVLGPMLEAAIDIGLRGEEVWSPNAEKNVYGGRGHGYRETYTPSKDIKGYRNVRVAYGPMGGVDPINQAVLMMQFHGGGGLSTRRMMELNPMIEDPQREEKQILKEKLQETLIAGLQQRIIQGSLDPVVLAIIEQAVASDEVTLSEAIAALVPPAPLVPPGGGGTPAGPPGAPPQPGPQGQAPGIAGAATGPQPEQVLANTGAGTNGVSSNTSSKVAV